MNGTTFRMPAHRLAAAAAATALAAAPALLAGAAPAHATGDQGRASAAVLRTGLDVSLLDKTVQVPLAVSLNEVRAPRSAEKTSLTATLDGVDGGRPFSVLRADVARAEATVTAERAEASTRLARARLHVPGLPLLSVVEVDAVTSKAVCARGAAPVASSTLPASLTVLGKRVSVTTGGTTDVKVPGVGEVRLDFAHRETTSRTAAATALRLRVTVDPLNLNVAEVEGTLTLAEATCEAPPAPASTPKPAVKPQGAPETADLAETGGSSLTPWLAAGATALLAAGAGALALARRKN
ncbi:SCO1860 family LAETG-anchored protein [Streptomyces galbus]|uniref:LPXTG cell wall anchor domain-containing protein n=1 Tax=Streptomyces galbus TaxID=33898 RepID=A0A4U5X0K1_STRGB|nr:SCO1860 family LAETG-anchored protein [Streptomyces galbus]TKT08468.1 LPXTG cell wall anchor domain-containing protein [Streptomyces galbus]GHD27338.1 LPXTG cell wall anchor domain-containing protein [Streptomyces galbus]